jgi:hypothetical protein
MAYQKKTAKEKLLDSKDFPRIVKIKPRQERVWGKGTIVIPKPLEVDKIMRGVLRGKLITINLIREKLAKKHKATIACPICTGIFASIAAQAAEEDRQKGGKHITPWWRTLKEKGTLNPKYPGGEKNQGKLLKKEGHVVVRAGKTMRVKDFEKKLVR